MGKYIFFTLVLVGLSVWIIILQQQLTGIRKSKFQPPPDPDVAMRDTADNGFSREYGFHHRPYCHFWSDAHIHTYDPDCPQEVRNKQLDDLLKVMYEISIVNGAIFCKTEEDLAFVASMGRHAPVWFVSMNDPDVEKLRFFHEKYRIRAVKMYNPSLITAESRGDSMEFPLGSGRILPVSIDWIVSPEWMRFYSACQELELAITNHTNIRYGPAYYNFGGDSRSRWAKLPYDNDYVFGLVEKILSAFPELKYILCHQGFMGHTRLSGLFEEYSNLYIDTSAGYILHEGDYLTDPERDRIRPFFIRWADRIIFGTDANVTWFVPEGQTEEYGIRRLVNTLVHPTKRFVQNLQLPQEELSKITHRNFEKVFKMPPAESWSR